MEQNQDEGYWQSLLGQNGTKPAPPPNVSAAGSGWALGEKSYHQGEILDLVVVGFNRGGLLVEVGDLRGFVPASQLAAMPRTATDQARMDELGNYVGKTLRLKAIECNRDANRLVFSERIVSPPVTRVEQLITAIEQGGTYPGTIRNVTDFGAFIDLGGVEGLVHISELSWKHVKYPRDVVMPGQQVQVMVIDIDRNQKRIACSIKRLTPNPWMVIAEQMKPGDWVEGVVMNIASFGAFVKIAEGVEGLIHISEMGSGNLLDPHTVMREGQTIKARVMNIDPMRKRISLSLRDNSSTAASQDAMPPPPDAGYWQSIAADET